MKPTVTTFSNVVFFVSIAFGSTLADADTIRATSCTQSAVQTAITSASAGDTVSVPAGNCAWGGLNVSKAIMLVGAGSGATVISRSGENTFTKSTTHVTKIAGFTFTNSGGGNASKMWYLRGAQTARPILVGDNVFNMSSGGMIRLETNGVIFYRNTVNCTTGDESWVQHSAENELVTGWNTPDTLGTRDTNGERNAYFEDNTINFCSAQGVDFDNASRSVFRFNTLKHSSWNSHGNDTSGVGNRHFEIYNNSFLYPNNMINQNWQIWIRGGTGVVYNNRLDNIIGQEWGDKDEVRLSVRAASDGAGYPGGCCTTWPCVRQLGQNHNGTAQFLDGIRFWSNTGTHIVEPDQAWGQCGGPTSEFILSGRDYFIGSPRPNYAAYPYPHPLRSGESTRPNPPEQVTIE